MTVRITNDHLDKFIFSLENKWPRKKSFMRRRVILETSPDSITASQQLRDSKLRFALKKKKKILWLGRCWKCWVSTNQDPNKANPSVSVPRFMKHAVKKSLWIATNSWVSLILLLWLVSNGAGLSPSKTFIYHEKAHSKRRSKLFLSKRESISSDQEHIFKPVFPAAGCPKSLSCLQVPCDSRHSPGFLIPLPLSNTIQIPQLKFFPPSSSSSPFSTVSLLFSKDVRNSAACWLSRPNLPFTF